MTSKVAPEVIKAAWLLLNSYARPIYVAESNLGFSVGDYGYCCLAKTHVECAGYFDARVELAHFADCVNEAAAVSSDIQRSRELARARRGRR